MKKSKIISEKTVREVEAILAQLDAQDAEKKDERLRVKKRKKRGKGWINIISVPFGGQPK